MADDIASTAAGLDVGGYLKDVFTPSGDAPLPNDDAARPPKPAIPPPKSILDQYRSQFPGDKDVSDDEILKGARLRLAPNVNQDRFNALARDPNGRAGIEAELKKPPTGLQRLREQFPEWGDDDNGLMHGVYDRLAANKKLDPVITSFEDFKDLMDPQAGAMNTAWHAWQDMGRSASAAGHQMSSAWYGIINTPNAWREAFRQLLDKYDPVGDRPGTQLKNIGDQALDWWTQKLNQMQLGAVPNTWRDFVSWVAAKGEQQQKATQVDLARRDQAQKLAEVSGGAVGGTTAKVAGVLGQQGAEWGIGTLMYMFPGSKLKAAATLAGAIQGNLSLNAAVQAHHDNAIIEGIQGIGWGAVQRFMWDSPNGRAVSMATNLLADTGEDQVEKWLRGEKSDVTEAATGAFLDLTLGAIAGRHAEAKATYRPSEARFYPEGYRPFDPTSLYQSPENLFRGKEEVVPGWSAAGEEYQKAIEARERGDYKKAAEFTDRALAMLSREDRGEVGKAIVQVAQDAATPIQPLQKAITPEAKPGQPAPPAENQALKDIVRNKFFGLSPQRGETGVAANPFGGRQYRWTADKGLEPIEEKPENIAAAASRFPTGNVYTGKTHYDALEAAGQTTENFMVHPDQIEHGFTTNTGRFVNRSEAYDIAQKAQQTTSESVPGDLHAREMMMPEAIPPKIENAYLNILPTQLGSAVKINDLARESGMSIAETKKVVSDLAAKGDATLDEGHWPSATEEERAAAITQRGTPRLLVRFPRLADRSQAGFTINWINEMANWIGEHWAPAISRFRSTFEPQHLSRGPEAVATWIASKQYTTKAQQALEAIPREAARLLRIDKVIRDGEKVSRRSAVFDGMSEADLREALSQSEEGLVHTGNSQVDWLFNSFYRPLFQEINANERLAGFDYKARDFYFFHALKPNEQERFVRWFDAYKQTNPRWTEQRQLPTYRMLFQAGFKPITLNPERLFQMRLASSLQAIRQVMTLRHAEELGGAIATVKRDAEGKLVPALSDEARKTFENDPKYTTRDAPNGEKYIITKNADQVVQNAWERSRIYNDFALSPLWKAIAISKGLTSRSLLAWSLTHMQHIGVVYPGSTLIRIERNLLGPNRRAAFNEGLSALLKSPRTASRILNQMRGIEQHLTPEEQDAFEDLMKMGGGYGVSQERQMEWGDWLREQFPKWRNDPNLRKLALVGKMLDAGYYALSSEPLQDLQFKHVIPTLKIAASLEARASLYETRPELLRSGNEFAREYALAKIGDTIDARFGELNWDNIYWAKMAKDIGQMSYLSPGWTMNTVNFFGGFAHDMSSNVAHMGELWKKLRGKPSEHQFLTDRILFTLNYSIAAMLVNGTRQYIWTGLTTGQPQLPQGQDYVFPRIRKDENGKWLRARPIEFITELPVWISHIQEEGGLGPGIIVGTWRMNVNKLNPVISNVINLFQNKNYFGQEIWSRIQPWNKQTLDMLRYVTVDPFIPITWQTALKSWPHFEWQNMVASFFGLPPASKRIGRTHVENMIEDTYYREYPSDTTKEAQELRQAHDDLARSVREKNQAGIKVGSQTLRKLGESEKTISNTITHAHAMTDQERLRRHFKALKPNIQQEIIAAMSPEERKIYVPFAKPGIRQQLQTVGAQ